MFRCSRGRLLEDTGEPTDADALECELLSVERVDRRREKNWLLERELVDASLHNRALERDDTRLLNRSAETLLSLQTHMW